MHLITSFLLLNTGVHAALGRYPKAVARSPAFLSHLYGSGLVSRQECDGQECADGCIPLDATCCDVTIGIYCEAGESCTTTDTCCPDGQSCDGSDSGDSGDTTGGCDDDQTLCGPACIPSDFECCDNSLGQWCETGYSCLTSSTCSPDDNTGDDTSTEDDADDDSSGDTSDDDSSSDSDTSKSGDDDSSDSRGDEEEDVGSIVRPSLLALAVGAMVMFAW